ncbi:hypothetical protein BVC80_1721g34 [Macleaya cordata]|uniref:Uncharacterized protein n=1 Tax=Macleaya cordata TaxID=56857 RepID=A0A200QCH6_MACCD|nr:hypothetical protein BVC80_1721g34 [Macleaya cordata]
MQTAMVRQLAREEGEYSGWDLGLRRDINDWEMEELSALLAFWVFPGSVEACLIKWESPNKKPKAKVLWTIMFFAVTWSIWKERNNGVFNGEEEKLEKIIANIKALEFSWVSPNRLFAGVRCQEFMFFWDSLLW